jgi:hypothetical protein
MRSSPRLFLRCIDKAGQAARYATPYPAHEVTLQYLLEDLNKYALGTGEQVLVLADEVHTEARHRANFSSRLRARRGTGRPTVREPQAIC